MDTNSRYEPSNRCCPPSPWPLHRHCLYFVLGCCDLFFWSKTCFPKSWANADWILGTPPGEVISFHTAAAPSFEVLLWKERSNSGKRDCTWKSQRVRKNNVMVVLCGVVWC